MKFTITATAALAALSNVAAQRPTNTSICDYYTSALLMDNTAENQYTLLKLIVNTVAIGNYTTPNMNAVPGILAPGKVNGTAVNLMPFFTGMAGRTTNRNGTATAGVNFLDGGGAAPLMNNTLPTAGSNQYTLVTHLYQYFGYLLGCSMQGTQAFASYGGRTSQYTVHKYMDITHAQNTWFIQQVGLAAQSFGVASADVTAVGTALDQTFNYRCSKNASVPSTAPAAAQAICIANDCPLAVNSSCAAYVQTQAAGVGPNGTVVNAGNVSLASSASSASGSARASGAAGGGTGTSTTSSAAKNVIVGSFVGAAAFAAALI
ncbi:protein of unknown function [Taphrina deformans PYCC 5710]|uniref:Uncharacterized protein n=1 Tax=Taphrina deformans (strain PYCC 5710 / ATCC 11124 / CBS 356.35 / IMI 108563 / JCM 9778 / NBRC 8474) TaxID=1097556 RepID=R4XAU4_TAPDE|nr:protein of unknown function [Taphrina deformans PYCC 5710]|eukprot:CCG81443.1 protein of unknown function [Taphrina deformans PYCC 5710]